MTRVQDPDKCRWSQNPISTALFGPDLNQNADRSGMVCEGQSKARDPETRDPETRDPEARDRSTSLNRSTPAAPQNRLEQV
jgi:hypothetical protein